MLARLTPHIAIPLDAIIILIGICILILSIIEYRKAHKKEAQAIENTDTTSINPNISKIESPEPPNRLPVFFDVVLLILTGIIFLGAAYEIIVMNISKASFNVLGLAFFTICFIGAPVLVWVDIFYWERKHIKSRESYRVGKTSFTYNADNIDIVFNRCYAVLNLMKADPPEQMNKPTLLKSSLKNSYITVTIKHIGARAFNIDVKSDAERVEIWWDWGRNKRNINTFRRLMLSNRVKDKAETKTNENKKRQ